MPDLNFGGSSASNPVAKLTMRSRDFPGDGFTETPSGTVTRTASGPPEVYDDSVFVRARGRQMSLRVENEAVGVNWRLGAPRLEARPDGRR